MMFSTLPIFAAALAQPAATSLTNVAAVAAAVREQRCTGEGFSTTANVLYEINHSVGVMLLFTDAGDSIVAHYDPNKFSMPVRVGDRVQAFGLLNDQTCPVRFSAR